MAVKQAVWDVKLLDYFAKKILTTQGMSRIKQNEDIYNCMII